MKTVTVLPAGKRLSVPDGATVLSALGASGEQVQTPCAGNGTCGKCRIHVTHGEVSLSDTSRKLLGEKAISNGMRLACQDIILSDATIEVPLMSDSQATQILTAGTTCACNVHPCITKTFFTLPLPNRDDAECDVNRLQTACNNALPDIATIRILPAFLRSNNFSGTAIIRENRIIGLEPGNTSQNLYGLAFDIGTTTVVGTLSSLISGEVIAVASRLNPQVALGDDVISRISLIRNDPGNLGKMRQIIAGTLADIIIECATQVGINIHDILDISAAGNTTMQEILGGIDPSALGEIPFVAAFKHGICISAAECNLPVHPAAQIYLHPQIGGFVGGDTVAGILASCLYSSDKPMLLVDIGTNGEIVLAHQGKLLATSAAAGPAFEGARIQQGMRASAGAIEKVYLDANDLHIEVIGGIPATGLCGSALIDSVASLLSCGIIDMMGRIMLPEELPSSFSPHLKARIFVDKQDQPAIILASKEQSANGIPVVLTQNDIRQLQLGVGAIRAGINILLERAEISPNDLAGILLAGAFGNFIRKGNAVRIGLLPPVNLDKINFIGNASCAGAQLTLLSRNERACAESIIYKTQHVDLSLDPRFQEEFAMAMMFPFE